MKVSAITREVERNGIFFDETPAIQALRAQLADKIAQAIISLCQLGVSLELDLDTACMLVLERVAQATSPATPPTKEQGKGT